jgi:tRNA U55 pseudouridine synthase TruB
VLEEGAIQAVLDSFVGESMQTPPPYSAVKVNGRPLYSYARAGESVEVAARPIVVHSMTLLGLSGSVLRFRVACGRGTYVRVLGEELAAALGTVGHLVALRRLRSGPFDLRHAVDFAALAQAAMGAPAPIEDWRPILRPARGAERVEWQDRPRCREGIWTHVLPPEFGFSRLPVQSVSESVSARVLASGTCPPPPQAVADGGRYVVADALGMLALVERNGKAPRVLRVLARPPVPEP